MTAAAPTAATTDQPNPVIAVVPMFFGGGAGGSFNQVRVMATEAMHRTIIEQVGRDYHIGPIKMKTYNSQEEFERDRPDYARLWKEEGVTIDADDGLCMVVCEATVDYTRPLKSSRWMKRRYR